MARARPLFRNFSGGEIAPQLDGLIDSPAHGCKTLENFIVRKQGGITRRPGTFYAGAANDDAETTRLYPFTNTAGTSFVLEFSDYNLEIWKQSTHAVVETLVTPWPQTDVFELKLLALGDEVRITNDDYQPRTITWVSDTSWTIAVAETVKDVRWVVAGDGRTIQVSSDDGMSWVDQWLPSSDDTTDLNAIAYGGGRAVIGPNDGLTPEVFVSTNGGKVWTVADGFGGVEPYCRDIVYADGTFLMCGGVAASGQLATSTDGLTWTPIAVAGYSGAYATDYSPTLDLWVVVGDGTGSGQIITSPDLITWTARGAGTGSIFAGVFWSQDDGAFVATSDGGHILASTDGITWSEKDKVDEQVKAVCYGGGNWLVGGLSGTIWMSTDRETWKPLRTLGSGEGITDLQYYDGTFIAVLSSPAGGSIWRSTDYGYTWYQAFETTNLPNKAARVAAYAFDASGKYPAAIAHGDMRVLVAGTQDDPDTVWGARTNHTDDFSIGYLATDGFEFKLANRRNANIHWMEAINEGVCIGAQNAIGFLRGSEEYGLTPLAAKFKWTYPHGSADIQGIALGDGVAYAQRGGEVIRAFPSDNDLTHYSDHIAKGGVTQFEYLDDPQAIFFAVRADGELLCMTAEKEIQAWSRWATRDGDEIESVAVVPNGTSNEDEIWMCVKRDIGGSTKRFIEYTDAIYFSTKEDCHYVDSGVESHISGHATISAITAASPPVVTASGHGFSNGNSILVRGVVGMTEVNDLTFTIASVATDTFALSGIIGSGYTAYISGGTAYLASAEVSGLAHLNGEECVALIDGNVVETVTPSGGLVALSTPGHHVHVGLACASIAQLCRLGTGFAHGIPKQISKLYAWVHNSIGGRFGSSESAYESVAYTAASELTTDMLELPYPGDWSADSYIWAIQADPLPLTIMAIGPEITTGER